MGFSLRGAANNNMNLQYVYHNINIKYMYVMESAATPFTALLPREVLDLL